MAEKLEDRQPRITRRETVLDVFYKAQRVELEYPEKKEPVVRYLVDTKPAAAILLHHTEKNALVLVNQYRPASALMGHPFILEACAGVIDDGEDALTSILREAEEETGYKPHHVEKVGQMFTIPGVGTELLALFFAEVDESHRTDGGGGLHSEQELLEVFELPVPEVKDYLRSGRIVDAKTLVLLQWFLLEKV